MKLTSSHSHVRIGQRANLEECNGYLTTFLTVQTLGGWKASRAQLTIIRVTKYTTLCKIRRFAELYGLSFSVAGTVFQIRLRQVMRALDETVRDVKPEV